RAARPVRFAPRRWWSDDRGAGSHELLVLAIAQVRRNQRQLAAAVHSKNLRRVVQNERFDTEPLLAREAYEIGQVVLALRVFRPDGKKRPKERLEIERVDAAVDLPDVPDLRAGIVVFDNRLDLAILAHDAAVASRISDRCSED